MRKLIGAALVLPLTLGGCASVTRGWDDQIQINSNPPEANVRLSNGFACQTPCTLKISRKDEFTAVISKAGFQTEQVVVRTQIAGGGAAGFAGNILLGGVIGMGVDAASGATLEHCPNPIAVNLRPVNSRQPPSNPAALCAAASGDGQLAAAPPPVEDVPTEVAGAAPPRAPAPKAKPAAKPKPITADQSSEKR
jgi:hypothetical protein